jgi:hypothetical protein
MNEIIDKAVELLNPITFVPNEMVYYVTMNDEDLGGEDFCEDCIEDEVDRVKQYYNAKRQEIIEKHNTILETGYWEGTKITATPEEIERSKKYSLKDYPADAVFGYKCHDAHNENGVSEPRCCGSCGEIFFTRFEPSTECANNLLEQLKSCNTIDKRLKWKLDAAFWNYDLLEDETQKILMMIANEIIKRNMTEEAKKLGDEFVEVCNIPEITPSGYDSGLVETVGLTKREYYAGLAMQGLIANGRVLLPANVAEDAILYADALLEELVKEI